MEKLIQKLKDLTVCITSWKAEAEVERARGINPIYFDKAIELGIVRRDVLLEEIGSRFIRLRNLREKS